MDTSITKTDLKEFGEKLGRDIAEIVRRDFRVQLVETKQEIISHFNASQGKQNERMDRVQKDIQVMSGQLTTVAEDVAKVKSAVLDLMVTDRHLHNLVRELKRHGIPLDETAVFAT